MPVKKCPNCGAEYGLDDRFCTREGATLVTVDDDAKGFAARTPSSPSRSVETIMGGGRVPSRGGVETIKGDRPRTPVRSTPEVQGSERAQSPAPSWGRRMTWIAVAGIAIAFVVGLLLRVRGGGAR